MTSASASATPSAANPVSDRLLGASASLWFLCAAAGQIMFAAYLAIFYGGGALGGDVSVWNRIMAQGYIPGDGPGNAAVMIHVLLALVITLGGLIQLTPQVRAAVPAFHRWNGRVYLTLAVVITLAGLWLTWGRPSPGGSINQLAITLNGVLILMCAGFAVRHAIARRIDEHQRWATRLFLVVSGVWFLRIMVSGWIAFHQAPLWLGDHLDGPMGVAFGFASTLLPLAVYELYWRARVGAGLWPKRTMAAGFIVLAGLTAFGSYAAALIMWLPHII